MIDPTDDVDERSGIEATIANSLSELSDVDPVPTEVDASTSFSKDEVEFADLSWLTYVARVQYWLRLPRAIDSSGSAVQSATSLFELLGNSTTDEVLTTSDDSALLTMLGLSILRDRAERAVELKDRFLEAVDDGSVEAATSIWIEAWDETVESTISGPIVAKADTWSISDFAAKAKSGRLQLDPPYQRSDVWPTRDAQLLIESILRGIPLPSIIVLRPDKNADVPFEVVDGKQRLTSILRFMGAHPKAIQRVDAASVAFPDAELKALFKSDYAKFRRAWKNATGESLSSALEKEYYFPFKLSTASDALQGDLQPLAGKYYDQIKDQRVRVGGVSLDVSEVFETSTDYKIPIIEYTEASPSQIHEVFSLYNKQGKHLNAEEIRNAVYHEVALMRALSVAAGDSNLVEAAAFLESVSAEMGDIRQNLDDYGIAAVRYRRTKVLSWLASLLFIPTSSDRQKTAFLSTAQHINLMLDGLQKDKTAPLRSESTVRNAMVMISRAMEIHAASSGWSDGFRNAKGTKWQDLQLVASLLGVTLSYVVLGDDLEQRMIDCQDGLLKRSDSEWKRPLKTQTGTQWKYIATTALAIVDELNVNVDDASQLLRDRFESDSVATLKSAAHISD